MATIWQGPHFIAIAAASALAFGGGYMMAGRSRQPASLPPVINTVNSMADPGGFPIEEANGQTPRGRPDENELIARNAEPEDGGVAPGGNSSGRAAPEERRPAPPRQQQDDSKPPPSDSAEEDPGFDPGDR